MLKRKTKLGSPQPKNKLPPSAITRRRAVGGALLVIFGGSAAIYAVHEAHKPKSKYISEDETAELYLKIRDAIAAKMQEAPGKPIKIYILENHYDMNARAYELMILDIANKFQINHMMVETLPNLVEEIKIDLKRSRGITHPFAEDLNLYLGAPNPTYYVAFGINNDFTITGIDSGYNNEHDRSSAIHEQIAKKLLQEQLIKEFPDILVAPEIKVDLTYQIAQHTHTYRFYIGDKYNKLLTPERRKRITQIYANIIKQADNVLDDKRSAVLGEEIGKDQNSSVIIIGAGHAEIAIQKAREVAIKNHSNSADIVFSPTDLSEIANMPIDPAIGSATQDHARWASDHKKVLPYAGIKDFDPNCDITFFLAKAIKLAEAKQPLIQIPTANGPHP